MSGVLAPVLTCDGTGCSTQLFGGTHRKIGELRQHALRDLQWTSARRQSGRRYRLVDLCPRCGPSASSAQPPGRRIARTP